MKSGDNGTDSNDVPKIGFPQALEIMENLENQ